MNRDHLLAEAKRLVLELSDAGYAPPARGAKSCYAAGRDALAALRAGLYIMQQGDYMSEYDLRVSQKVAWILCGGGISSAQWVDEQYFLDLEREAFSRSAASRRRRSASRTCFRRGSLCGTRLKGKRTG